MATLCAWATRSSFSVPETGPERPRYCSRCGNAVVVAGAAFCKDCGAPLGAHLLPDSAGRLMVAAALSIVPGLGHLYRGYPWRGLAWFIGVVLAYSSYPLGLLLHLICAASAALAGMGELRPARAVGRSRPRVAGSGS